MDFRRACLLFGSLFSLQVITALQTKVAIVNEKANKEKREVTFLPDGLDLHLETADERIPLNLKRMKNIDHNNFKIEFDDPTIKVEDLKLNSRNIGYYQDVQMGAAVTVEAVYEDAQIKRTLTGTLFHKNNMYELNPASQEIQDLDNILETKGLGNQYSHRVHILKEVDKKMLKADNFGKVHHPSTETLKKTSTNLNTEEERLREAVESLKEAMLKKKRTKRQSTGFIHHVEMLFLVDYSVYQEFDAKFGSSAYAQLVYHYTHILNGMYLAYGTVSPSSGFRIMLWLSKLVVITQERNELLGSSYQVSSSPPRYNSDPFFEKLQTYVQQEGYTQESLDHFMYWTRKDLFSGSNNILGVAYVCSSCFTWAISQNEDNGNVAWHTAAHEMAHGLGADHDTPGHCGGQQGQEYIMYYSDYVVTQSNLNTAFRFSTCSASDMEQCTGGVGKYSQYNEKTCLKNTVCSHHTPLQHIDELPGERFTADDQCKVHYDDGMAKSCSTVSAAICRQLKCELRDGGCYSGTFRAADGTNCNSNDATKVCYLGNCVSRNTIPSSSIDDNNCNTPSPSTTPSPAPPPNPNPPVPNPTPNPPSDTPAPPSSPPPPTSPPTGEACQELFGAEWTICPSHPLWCVKFSYFCDGEIDCPSIDNGPDDETGCEGSTTSPGASLELPVHYCLLSKRRMGVRCPNQMNKCLHFKLFCNGVDNCDDGSDEDPEFCKKVPAPRNNFIRCEDDPSTWVRIWKYNTVCNTVAGSTWIYDAPRNCEFKFTERGLNCPNNQSICIPESYACDGEIDCEAVSGEVSDESQNFCQCGIGETACTGSLRQCVHIDWVYDDQYDCLDTSDEDEDLMPFWCGSLPSRSCRNNRWQTCPNCPFLPCIKKRWVCDGYSDCIDDSDELSCNAKKEQNDQEKEGTLMKLIEHSVIDLKKELDAEDDDEKEVENYSEFNFDQLASPNHLKNPAKKTIQMTQKEPLRKLPLNMLKPLKWL